MNFVNISLTDSHLGSHDLALLPLDVPCGSTRRSTAQLEYNPELHARTKYNIAHQFVPGQLDVVYVNTHLNLADIFAEG